MKRPDAQEFCLYVYPYVKKQIDKYRSKYSKRTYNQHQYTVLNLLREWWDCTYRELWSRVILMPGVKTVLELESVPHWTRIQQAFSKQSTLVYRMIQRAILEDCETGSIAGIDATGITRGRVSHYYTKRTKMHIKSLKTTVLVDCEEGWVLDVHLTTTRKHDTQIGPSLLRRMPDSVDILTGDKGYDDADFRGACRKQGLIDQIKYREFDGGGQAEANAFLDNRDYAKRNAVESFMFVMKELFGQSVRSRSWDQQFKEMVGQVIAYNIDRMARTDRDFLCVGAISMGNIVRENPMFRMAS
jgi:IS5 family transposase